VPTVSEVARVTTRDGAIWRTCAGCGALAAMAAEVDRCDACLTGAPVVAGIAGWLRLAELHAGGRLGAAAAFESLAASYDGSAAGLAAELREAAGLLRGERGRSR
jgi:hypothetical protein